MAILVGAVVFVALFAVTAHQTNQPAGGALVGNKTTPVAPTTLETSVATSRSASAGGLLMSLNPTIKVVGLGMSSNFTLSLVPTGNSPGVIALSAKSPAGLLVSISPSSINLTAQKEAVDVNIRTTSTTSPGNYEVTILGKSAVQEFNQTFHVNVVRYLIVIGLDGRLRPDNLLIRVGDAVTWLNVDDCYELNGDCTMANQHTLVFPSLSLTSGAIQTDATWTLTLNDTGTYEYHDSFNPLHTGTIVVAK